MNSKKLSFINLKTNFKYSVNIRFDIGDFNKINSFVPTTKNIELFKKSFHSIINNSASRAHILLGAYGTGKSMYANTLATILSKKENPDKYNSLIDKIDKYSSNLSKTIEREVNDRKPYLIVLPSTSNNSFKQSLLLGLQRALEEENIKNIFPKTHFSSIESKIKQWESEFPKTFESFKEILMSERGERVNEFIKELNNYDQNSYKFFEEIYPKLTSGSSFNPFYNCSLKEIFQEVNNEIRDNGYQGIYVIFDEFNRLLEDNAETFDGKTLQDFAEMTSNTSEDEIHLLLISHKNLVQYTKDLSQEQINEWKKIQGRFTVLDSSEYSSQIYELMSNVFIKESGKWEEFKKNNEVNFNKYLNETSFLNIYPDYNNEEIEKNIVKGCYPLHPLATYLLPELSQKVAQNERTIFTFLSTEENNTLGEFINEKKDSEFPVIRLSRIYNYFENLMQQEVEFTKVHQAWANSQRALQKIEAKNDYKEQFIKSLGVIIAVNKFSEVPPSREILRFALDNLTDNEFNKLIDELIEKKIILYRKSIDQFSFFEGSELDFNSIINEKIQEREHNYYGKYLLDENFKPSPIYPKKHNDKFKIRRRFVNEYMYLDEVKNTNWEVYLNKHNKIGYIDGLIVYLILRSKKEIDQAIEIIKNIENKRVLFVIPNNPINLEDSLQRMDALTFLKEDEDLLAQDPLAEKEIKTYYEEERQFIEKKLDKYIKPQYNNSKYYHNGIKIGRINSYRDLSKEISIICNKVYDLTPIVNNELIVKNKISGPQKSARKKVNNILIFKELKERLDIEGYGPDFLIYRTLFINTNILRENEEGNMILKIDNFDPENNDTNIFKVINKIVEYLSINEKISFTDIYDVLRKPPYGVKLGLIPFLLIIAFRLNNYFKNMVIRYNGEEQIINADLFEKINKNPKRYTVEIEEWNQLKEDYLVFLEGMFKKYINKKENRVNRVNKIYNGIKGWFYNLPNYTVETQEQLSDESLLLRNLINRKTSEVKGLLMDIIPKKIIGNKLKTEEDLEKIKEVFKNFFREHNQAYDQLLIKIQSKISNIFSDNNKSKSITDNLYYWYNSLDEKSKKYTYPDNEVNSFLNLFRISLQDLDNEELLNKLALITEGLEIKDWDDSVTNSFFEEIREIKKQIESKDSNEEKSDDNLYEFIIVNNDGEKYNSSFEDMELEGIAKILEKKVRGSFDDIGSSVSYKEKQQILIKILKDMMEDSI